MSARTPGASDREDADARPRVTPDIAAEAALWVARLHGPERNPAMEREFRAWQQRSAAHREAFERCTDVWMEVPRLKVSDAYGAVASARLGEQRKGARRAAWQWAMAAGVGVLFAGSLAMLQSWRDQGVYGTAVGEQRSIVLDDGTRMLLNTGTKVRVAFDAARRSVEIGEGEALFEVAKDANRPFVVHAAGSEVVAVGTAFAVRFTDSPSQGGGLAVTLIEGQVSVRPAQAGEGVGLAPPAPVTLRPGDRLRLDHRAGARVADTVTRVDRPNVEQVVAWRRREAVFQDVPLADAVSEMNRYSRTPVVLSGSLPSAGLHVSGVFRTGDNAGFARAVAALHGLTVREGSGRLELENLR